MFEKLQIFQTADAMARHAATRQAVISQNVANADTPGYRARDMADFASVWNPNKSGAMRATRASHLNGAMPQQMPGARPVATTDTAPNGNTVSLEEEMVKAARTKGQHSRALAVYRSGLSVLRASLGRR